MLGSSGNTNNISSQKTKQSPDESSQLQENDLDDEIPF